jgi:hypothetical protein
MTRLDHALAIAARGYPIFPLLPNSKVPYSGEGITAATRDPAVIRRWFATRPRMNYGVDQSGCVVIDIDMKNGANGEADWLALCATNDIPDVPTFEVETPSPGRHLWYTLFDCGQHDLAAGINVRSNNGYVVGPGSEIDGKAYRIVADNDPAPMPPELAQILRPSGKRADGASEVIGALDTPAALSRAAIYLAGLPDPEPHSRNNAGYKIAARLKDFGLSADVMAAMLDEAWNKRNSDPLDYAEIESIVENVNRYGQNPAGVRLVENDLEPVPADLLQQDAAPAEDDEPILKPLNTDFDIRDLPRRNWVVWDMLEAGQLTGLAAPPSAGKSTLALAIAVGIAAGDLSALGLKLGRPRAPVVWVSMEESEKETQARLWGACETMGVDRKDITGWIHVLTKQSLKLAVRSPETRTIMPSKACKKISDYITEVGAKMFVLDPLVELHEASENDNGELAKVMAIFRGIARSTQAAGLISHHTRKGATADGAIGDNIRGGSSFLGNVRACFMLNRATQEDADSYGLPQDKLQYTFRLDRAKGSYSPPGRDTKWYCTTSLMMPFHPDRDDKPCEYLPDDRAHGIELLTPGDTEEELREAWGKLLLPALELSGFELSLKDAASILVKEDAAGCSGDDQARKRLLKLFEKPAYIDGVSISVKNTNSGRAKKALFLDTA